MVTTKDDAAHLNWLGASRRTNRVVASLSSASLRRPILFAAPAVVGQPILKAIGMPGTFMQLFLALNLLAAAFPVKSRKGR